MMLVFKVKRDLLNLVYILQLTFFFTGNWKGWKTKDELEDTEKRKETTEVMIIVKVHHC